MMKNIKRLRKKPRMSMKLSESYGLNAPKSHVLGLSPHCGSISYEGKDLMDLTSGSLSFRFLVLLSFEDMVYSSIRYCQITLKSTLKEN